MKIPAPAAHGPLLIAPGAAKSASAGDLLSSLTRGQSVLFRVLGPSMPGGERIRIGGQEFFAAVPRPLPAGGVGRAVVKSVGPPLVLQVTEWRNAGKSAVNLNVLLGKEPVGAGAAPAPNLERWNASLGKQLPADGGPVSPERLREGILLARFLVFALAGAGERGTADPAGPTRKENPHRENGAEPGAGDPFWFFVPLPGEKGPVVFPGYRRKEEGQASCSWGLYLKLPDVGAVSARFVASGNGWRISLYAESATFAAAMSACASDFAAGLKEKGFPLLGVTVGKSPGGSLEAEVGAWISRDTGIPLVEKSA